jgi:glycosyltransferase involved in cell wall biosynthesis
MEESKKTIKILMATNTYTPCVGGVTKSVEQFVNRYRQRGHRVVVATASYKNLPDNEFDIIRFPAIHHFNGSDFSWPLPVPGKMASALSKIPPDIVHSHHPFVLGGTALRAAAAYNAPLVFTYHTMYEKYSHYMSVDSWRLKRYLMSLVTGFCNFCDVVIAPSESVALMLKTRGVKVPVQVIPTGIEVSYYANGDAAKARQLWNIPEQAFVVGHVGRLASEKNLQFLATSVAGFLKEHPQAWFALAGCGPMKQDIVEICQQFGVADRLVITGFLKPEQLRDAYKAMDVFAFSSLTETQGMVLVEAMAAGVPVVALDAPGVREVVVDGSNGRLMTGDETDFSQALGWIAKASPTDRKQLSERAFDTAVKHDIEDTVDKALLLYQNLIVQKQMQPPPVERSANLRMLAAQWNIATNIARAASSIPRSATWQPDRFSELAPAEPVGNK